jgi:hypothetical protein
MLAVITRGSSPAFIEERIMNAHKNQFQKPDLTTLKQQCPLPTLLRRMHLEKFAQSSCPSPLRKDKSASWGIYEKDGKHAWKDFGNGDGGDEITFLARYLGLQEKKQFPLLLRIYQKFVGEDSIHSASGPEKLPLSKPDCRNFGRGTSIQLTKLALLRNFHSQALEAATARGLLVFGDWHGVEVYGITDTSGNILELRCLDGKEFEAIGSLTARKSHAVKGSQKSWPVGIQEAKPYPCIALVEGIPDLIAAFQICVVEGVLEHVAPVAMLSAGPAIDETALPMFQNKHVRIFVHEDEAGRKAATKWKTQLESHAREVNFVSFSDFKSKGIKDLCDFKDLHATNFATNPDEWRVLPCH